jgi:hypothetical protein
MNRPFLSIGSSPPPLFDALRVATWRVDMHSNVSQATVRSVIPGVLYVFVIVQDGAGGRTFNWPPNCLNPAGINAAPNAITVQCFVGLPNNILNANIPAGMYL